MSETPAGWYPDPTHRHHHRFWDGMVWSDHVADHGVQGVDPVLAPPPPISVDGSDAIDDAELVGNDDVTDLGPPVWSESNADHGIAGGATAEVMACTSPVEPAVEPAGASWYADPAGRGEYRYFDGEAWSSHIASAGNTSESDSRRRFGRIKIATKRLADAEDPKGRKIGSYQRITLYERYIETPQGSGSIEGATATVDTAGNLAVTKRATLTRMATGGALLGGLGMVASLGFQKRKDIDMRELYLMVETNEFAAVVECPKDDGKKAREFAAFTITASRQYTKNEPLRQQTIKWARYEIPAAQTDTKAIDDAKDALAEVHADRALQDAVTQARAELEVLNSTVALESEDE